ncbi:hypothetical protein EAO27_13310 [Sphingopyxis sp. YF1]|uniref:immunity 70 family protein n=1 Tax=Sphingopyxis sp. YF1 TaxID=2482763 RepID=UPI001F6186DD|nr:immunity 70 family protein [Sphingopyxis sp. YF1]UNU43586.1 hypothetical protein EAO27_13310 [Sphingopyxis sp. YF1]
MAVGIKVGSITDEIGTADFFHAFFSTISATLEDRWGARFPVLLNQLYQGSLPHSQAATALSELAQISSELAAFPPSAVVWDIDDRTKQPPWGDNISEDITNLANYFVTSTGRDLIVTVTEALDDLHSIGGSAEIVQC